MRNNKVLVVENKSYGGSFDQYTGCPDDEELVSEIGEIYGPFKVTLHDRLREDLGVKGTFEDVARETVSEIEERIGNEHFLTKDKPRFMALKKRLEEYLTSQAASL